MIIIEDLKIVNIGTIKIANLKGFKDLNIFIGDNNCGKTTVLKCLDKLRDLTGTTNPLCPACQQAMSSVSGNIMRGKKIPLPLGERYLKSRKTELIFSVNIDSINSIVPDAIMEAQQALVKNNCNDPGCANQISLGVANDNELNSVHLSPLIHNKIIAKLSSEFVFCPDDRLGQYKGKKYEDYIGQRNLAGRDLRTWTELICNMVDEKVVDFDHALNLKRRIENNEYPDTIQHQGSGVRSAACILVDLVSAGDAHILLIDEPELGLNPTSKQSILQLLLAESKDKQIFIATHDPTFVNPTLWCGNDKVAVFTYSPYKDQFIKVNLDENKENPEVFAGYLPHTTSLKDVHIYVEGSSDAYIFQVFLRKVFRGRFKDWANKLNRVGIFHLGGDFWPHLMHTVPKSPYKCIVILDGDKRDTVKEVYEQYNRIKGSAIYFELVEKLDSLKDIIQQRKIPICCLEENCIEEYLKPKPKYKSEEYQKAIDGPIIAESMERIPEEIGNILNIICDIVT